MPDSLAVVFLHVPFCMILWPALQVQWLLLVIAFLSASAFALALWLFRSESNFEGGLGSCHVHDSVCTGSSTQPSGLISHAQQKGLTPQGTGAPDRCGWGWPRRGAATCLQQQQQQWEEGHTPNTHRPTPPPRTRGGRHIGLTWVNTVGHCIAY